MYSSTEKEVWKDVKGFEGRYQVSNFGRVKSLERVVTYGDRFHTVAERIKKPTLKKRRLKSNGEYINDGYLVMGLSKDNKNTMKHVHRLVLEAFTPNHENKETVNHIDGNKQNNHLSNLEWATYQENNDHAFETGLSDPNNLVVANHVRSMKVKKLDDNGNVIDSYPSMRAAERANGMANGSISNAIKKGYRSAGYYWKV